MQRASGFHSRESLVILVAKLPDPTSLSATEPRRVFSSNTFRTTNVAVRFANIVHCVNWRLCRSEIDIPPHHVQTAATESFAVILVLGSKCAAGRGSEFGNGAYSPAGFQD